MKGRVVYVGEGGLRLRERSPGWGERAKREERGTLGEACRVLAEGASLLGGIAGLQFVPKWFTSVLRVHVFTVYFS